MPEGHGRGITKAQGAMVAVLLVVAAAGVSYLGFNLYNKPSPPTGNPPSQNYTGYVIASFPAGTPMVTSYMHLNYTMDVTALGDVPGAVALAANTTDGFTISFSPDTVGLSGSRNETTVTMSSSGALSPGTYSISLRAVAPGFEYNETLQVTVVRYLVVTLGAQFYPNSLTVPVGSTVTWLRLNGPLSQYDNGTHNVVFDNGMARSPNLLQYQTWTYTFNQTGTFPYLCTFHTDDNMTGVIVVQ
ncbi:MAG: hypothetical protein JRN39_06415 [Nitrososphaerota archaeon]|nr:hypothetical protein [Nitrososphaerota archaeon]MDG6940017.1 hypothetical protein [Nitrososphaerota archaeon]